MSEGLDARSLGRETPPHVQQTPESNVVGMTTVSVRDSGVARQSVAVPTILLPKQLPLPMYCAWVPIHRNIAVSRACDEVVMLAESDDLLILQGVVD